MLSRSVLEILIDLSSFISVPEAHVAEQRVGPTAEPEAGPSGPVPPLIRIASGPDRAPDAFVAVPFRGYWFWIDDRAVKDAFFDKTFKLPATRSPERASATQAPLPNPQETAAAAKPRLGAERPDG